MRDLINEINTRDVLLCNQCRKVYVSMNGESKEQFTARAKENCWGLDYPFGAVCPTCEPYTPEMLEEE